MCYWGVVGGCNRKKDGKVEGAHHWWPMDLTVTSSFSTTKQGATKLHNSCTLHIMDIAFFF
jgi:hypothetical protein